MLRPDIGVDERIAVSMYRGMRLIRRFEERVVQLVNENAIAGITHEYVGQEAVAVGVCAALNANDVITSTHRGHGHILAKGGQARFMFAELMGRVDGYNKGRGGSMHIADLSLGIFGANGIVGAGAPIACGAAHTFKRRSSTQVACTFLGDGAMNQGVLQESLNLAAILELPILFVCENNGYAVTMPVAAASKEELWKRAASNGIASEVVDGMDVLAVYAAASRAVQRARVGEGPSFIECRTYRYLGHHTAERLMKLNYRSDSEVEQWRQRDPLEAWARNLVDSGIWSLHERATIDQSVEQELDDAVEFARHSEWPAAADALSYMYATPYPGIPSPGVGEPYSAPESS